MDPPIWDRDLQRRPRHRRLGIRGVCSRLVARRCLRAVWLCLLVVFAKTRAWAWPKALRAAAETELKDESGKTILHYIVEAPASVAPAHTTDPARKVGVIFCFQEHTSPPGADIFPVRQSLKRLGLSEGYLPLAIRAQSSGGGVGKADYEPIQKLLAWAKKTYPVNPRRVYMYGKGSGGHVAGEFTMLYPNLITAGISYSWGWWTMPSELDKPSML